MSPTCTSCKYFGKLSPGFAAICFEKWRHLSPYGAVPLTTADETCDQYSLRPADHPTTDRQEGRAGR